MEEQLIEFSTAKLAKEKGFDVKCGKWYVETLKHELDIPRSGLVKFPAHKPRVLHHEPKEDWHIIHCSAPTQSLLQKWLQEIHNISIKVDDFYTKGELRFDFSVGKLGSQDDNPKGVFKDYEEALEAGLFEALTLIK